MVVGGTVAGMDGEGGGKTGEAVEGFDHEVRLGAGEIDAAVGSGEEGVAGDEDLMFVGQQADAAGGVAGGVEDGEGEVAEGDFGTLFEEGSGVGGLPGKIEAEGLGLGGFDHGSVGRVDEEGRAGVLNERGVVGDVTPVAVGVEDGVDGGVEIGGGGGEDGGGVLAGIDGEGVAVKDDQVGISVDGADREGVDLHGGVRGNREDGWG